MSVEALSCNYCGGPVKSTEKFCQYCGREIKIKADAPNGVQLRDPTPNPPPPPQPNTVPSSDYRPRKKGPNILPIAFGSIFVIIFLQIAAAGNQAASAIVNEATPIFLFLVFGAVLLRLFIRGLP